MSNSSAPTPEFQYVLREQDRLIPVANVIRIMRKTLPPHAKISDNAKETIQECVSEFISFVTSEANERCQREQRKTITAKDVLWAMGKLGFEEYLEPLTMYINCYRKFEGEHGLMQVESVQQGPVEIATLPPPSYPHGFPMAHPHQGKFVPPRMGGYFKDDPYMNPNQAPNSSSDLYPPFK